MKREAEPSLRSSKRHKAANMDDALAAMERLGSIYFLKTLPKTAIPALAAQKKAYMEDMRSELEVHIFRGPEGCPYFPDLCASFTATDDDDDEEDKHVSNSEEENFAEHSDDNDKLIPQIHVRTSVHHRHARNRASTGYGRDGKAAPDHKTKHSENDKALPGFRKLLTVSSILRTDNFALPR